MPRYTVDLTFRGVAVIDADTVEEAGGIAAGLFGGHFKLDTFLKVWNTEEGGEYKLAVVEKNVEMAHSSADVTFLGVVTCIESEIRGEA